jgi:(E)-4-hydroxy-3-methylbut-2-enyl-diphosphate synthase
VVPENEMVAALVEEAEKLVNEGFEARLAAADKGAAREAEVDRMALLDARGSDANQSEALVELINRRLGPAGARGAGTGAGAGRAGPSPVE